MTPGRLGRAFAMSLVAALVVVLVLSSPSFCLMTHGSSSSSSHDNMDNSNGDGMQTLSCTVSPETVGATGDLLDALVAHTYFKLFKVSLSTPCAFWNTPPPLCTYEPPSSDDADHAGSGEGGAIPSGGCGVRECPVEQVPIPVRVAEERVDRSLPSEGINVEWSGASLSSLDDEDMIYVNLQLNPESNTGYSGEDAARVWRAIYMENCFKLGGPTASSVEDDLCLEQRVFYRLLSGLHTSINLHIAHNFYNITKPTDTQRRFAPNLELFEKRIAPFPDRIRNLYFLYSFVLRAIHKASPVLSTYNYDTGFPEEDALTRQLVQKLNQTISCSETFDESAMFRGGDKESLRDQMRSHFRNISMIMDCVGCEKCKLWAKLETLGLATALKIVLSENGKTISSLQRNEVVALINLARQLVSSIRFSQKLQQMSSRARMNHYIYWVMVGIAVLAVIRIVRMTISYFTAAPIEPPAPQKPARKPKTRKSKTSKPKQM